MRNEDMDTTQNFANLHNRLYGKIFSFVRMRVKDKSDVEDIVQDVFLKAYNSWVSTPNGIPDESSAKNFLYIMARQRMIDMWRSAKNRFQTEAPNFGEEDYFDSLDSDEPLPEDVFVQNEKKDYVTGLLNKLKKEEREILMLRFLEEMEYKELAKIYKTSEDNIRQKVSRSLQNLKKVAKKD